MTTQRTQTITAGGVTIYGTKVDYNYTKILASITTPQSTDAWASGPNDTMIVDLLRVEKRITIIGFIESASRASMTALVTDGGTFTLTISGQDPFTVNIEKLQMTESASNDNDEIEVQFTVIVGVDI